MTTKDKDRLVKICEICASKPSSHYNVIIEGFRFQVAFVADSLGGRQYHAIMFLGGNYPIGGIDGRTAKEFGTDAEAKLRDYQTWATAQGFSVDGGCPPYYKSII